MPDQNLPSPGQPARLSPPENLPVSPNNFSRPVPPQPLTPQIPSEGVDLRFSDTPNSAKTQAPELPAQTSRLTPTPPIPPPMQPGKPLGAPVLPTEYKTSIRTMHDDVSKIKVGQQPIGTEQQKTVTPGIPKPAITLPAVPSAPQGHGIRASLGETEKTKPLNTPAFQRPIAPGAPVPPPALTVAPPPRRFGSKLFLIALALIALGIVGYFLLRNDETAVSPSPTQLATQTPTPTPPPSIASYLAGVSESIILSDTNQIADLQSKINALAITGGELRKLVITTAQKGTGDLDIIDLLDLSLATYPPNVKAALGDDSMVLVYGQREAFLPTGQLDLAAPVQERLIFITEIRDTAGISAILKSWEPTMADSLASILTLDKKKAASSGFLDNSYGGSAIRYRNFSQPDRSIDYTISRAPNGKSYLVIGGSRESAFTIIDRLR